MKIIKKIVTAVLCATIVPTILTGCGKEDLLNKKAEESVAVANYTAPEVGEKIAVIKVKDYGEIKIKLFPEYAAKGVENFTALAEMDYYDELIFHRVIEGFVIQGGDPKGNGQGGNSVWGTDFDIEASPNLYHFSGAVAYAHAQNGGNGSQFYIVCTQPGETFNGGKMTLTEDMLGDYSLSDEAKKAYLENGGVPFLDGGYTVFGQVFEGMDIVYEIAAVRVDESDLPTKQVVIESVEIVEYQG